jgi:hypothetical protein
MRQVAVELLTELGDPCVLSYVVYGNYDPATGKTQETVTDIATFSSSVRNATILFGNDGQNTGLEGFSSNKVIVPYINQDIDTTWKYNGYDITAVSPISTQGMVVAYTLTVAEG